MAGRKRVRFAERRKAMGLSQERLAEAVGVDTSTVARWERGETEPQAVHRPRLAEALKVTVEKVGELLAGAGGAVPGYLTPYGLAELPSAADEAAGGHAAPPYAWGALRTLEDLAVFLRSDMLTRRDILAASITMAAGATLTEPVARWLATNPGGLPTTGGGGLGKVGLSAVEAVERSVRYFVTSDATVGGGLAREAAIGQLTYAVDLARAGTEQARLRTAGVLHDLALMAREAGQLDTARSLLKLALDRVPDDPHRFNTVRASLRSHLARVLSGMVVTHSSQVDRYVHSSFELHHRSGDDEPTPWLAGYFPHSSGSDSDVASDAAAAYHALAREDARFTGRAQQHARQALEHRGDGLAWAKVFDQVMLARIRLRAGLLDQAHADGREAIRMAEAVSGSQRVRARLAQLLDDTTPHQREPAVRELREVLTATVE